MKHWKKILVAMLTIIFAYVYSATGESGFNLETFVVLVILIGYVILFFQFLDKLFSR